MGRMRGAEAVLRNLKVLGIQAVEKLRVSKKYRNPALDERIRRERTRREARLLSKAKLACVLCPVVYQVGKYFIRMKLLKGTMLHRKLLRREITANQIASAANILVRLHRLGIIHGDYTPANLMLTREGMAVIDFGLGYISDDSEDKATDVLMMKRSLGAKGEAFVNAYAKAGGKNLVVRMVSEIEKRARYMERG